MLSRLLFTGDLCSAFNDLVRAAPNNSVFLVEILDKSLLYVCTLEISFIVLSLLLVVAGVAVRQLLDLFHPHSLS